MATQSLEFAALGGMNQDDSLIVPAKDNAGKSLFTQGDYRYALNFRSQFGEGENILGSLKINDYYVSSQILSNSAFFGTLSPWQQLDDGPGYTAWTYASIGPIATYARLASTSASFTSRVLYQTGVVLSDTIIVSLRGIFVALIGGTYEVTFKLVYLNGTTILEEEEINANDLIDTSYVENHTPPEGADGIGFRIIGSKTGSGTFNFYVDSMSVFQFAAGTKPTGTNKTVGKVEDPDAQKVYFCNYNSLGNHTICYYDHSTRRVYELLRWSGLNFTENSFVSMAKLDNWIAFTDRVNSIRLIDVNTITELFRSLGSSFREFHIAFHKWSPIAPPVPRVLYNGTIGNNYSVLKNKIYHFAFRIIYRGNLKSTYSPISKGAITSRCGTFYGSNKQITYIEVEVPIMMLDTPGANTQYNFFGWDSIKFTEAVEAIELVYREGELELWKKWKTVQRRDFAQYYYFDGLSADQTPVPDEEFLQSYDAVPFLAGTVEAIDNRFVFGDCQEELDPVQSIDIDSVSVVTDPTADWNDSSSSSFSAISNSTVREKLLRLNSLSDFKFKPRGLYKVGVVFFHHTGWRSQTYTNDSWVFNVNVATNTDTYRLTAFNFIFGDSFTPPEWAVAFQIVRTNCLNVDSFIYGSVNRFIPLIDEPKLLTDIINASQATKDAIISYINNSELVNGYDIAGKEPSSSAFSFVPGRDPYKLFGLLERKEIKKNSFKEGRQSYNDQVLKRPSSKKLASQIRTSIETNLFSAASRICIDVDNWYNAAQDSASSNKPLNKIYYTFREGDRVRFVGSDVLNPTSNQYLVYDVPIIEFTGRSIIIEKPAGLLWTARNGSSDGSLMSIEVYTPKQVSAEDHLFFETGEVYPILYPGTSNRDFSKRNWNYTSNSAVTFNSYGPFDVFHQMPFFYGDVCHVQKTVYRSTMSPMTGTQSNTIEAMMGPDPDVIYDWWDHNNGRPYVAYFDLPTVKFKPTQIRFTGKIIEESNVNQINRCKPEDYIVYPSEYGRIRALINTDNAQVESTGSILLVLGERKPWSVYINRTTLEDLGGRTQFVLSNKVLGSFNTLLGDGTMNPESISKFRGNVYWFDAVNGTWNRYGRDGVTRISQYKMRRWFKELGDLLLPTYQTDEKPWIISDFDGFHDELYTHIDHSSLPSTFRGYSNYKGMIFNEDDNRWTSAHNIVPEFFSKVGSQMLMFKDGEVHLHEKGTNYSTFLGQKFDVMIEPVFTMPFVKHWQTLATMSSHKWSAESIKSEYRGTKSLLSSSLSLAEFTDEEDTYKAAIKRNANTPNVSNPRLEGAPMACKAIQVLFKLDPSVVAQSLFFYAFAGYEDSPKNP